jgi:hypothetical protein
LRVIGIGDSAGKLRGIGGPAANLGVCVPSGLSLGRGVRLGNLPFFTTGDCFSDRGDFGPAGGFQAFRCGCASGFFGFAESTPSVGIGVFGIGIESYLRCVACSGIRGCGCIFSLGLSQQRLLAHLLGGAMPQLRTVLTTRRREVAIFSSMKICPRVKYSNVFRCFRYAVILDLV